MPPKKKSKTPAAKAAAKAAVKPKAAASGPKAPKVPASKLSDFIFGGDHILASTASRVVSWDGKKVTKLLKSKHNSIKHATMVKDGSHLAISGSNIVVLKKMNNKTVSHYRIDPPESCNDDSITLKSSHDGRFLFITSTLKHAVAIYNMRDQTVQWCKSHNSPITSYTISSNSRLVLSASCNPRMVVINNLDLQTHFVPDLTYASESFIVASTFHPVKKHIFALAFGDGVIAAFDYSMLSGSKHIIGMLNQPHYAQIGATGVAAVEFLPGRDTRAISIGHDQRMCLIDFERGGVLSSWKLEAPPTSLSIRTPGIQDQQKWLAAVGTVHGRVFVYNDNLNMVGNYQLSAEGNPILSLEWVRGDVGVSPEMDFDRTAAEKMPYLFESGRGANKVETGLSNAQGKADGPGSPKSPIILDEENEAASDNEAANPSAELSYMQSFSPVKAPGPRRSARLSLNNIEGSMSSTPGRSAQSLVAPKPSKRLEPSAEGLYATVSAPQVSAGITDQVKEEAQVAGPSGIQEAPQGLKVALSPAKRAGPPKPARVDQLKAQADKKTQKLTKPQEWLKDIRMGGAKGQSAKQQGNQQQSQPSSASNTMKLIASLMNKSQSKGDGSDKENGASPNSQDISAMDLDSPASDPARSVSSSNSKRKRNGLDELEDPSGSNSKRMRSPQSASHNSNTNASHQQDQSQVPPPWAQILMDSIKESMLSTQSEMRSEMRRMNTEIANFKESVLTTQSEMRNEMKEMSNDMEWMRSEIDNMRVGVEENNTHIQNLLGDILTLRNDVGLLRHSVNGLQNVNQDLQDQVQALINSSTRLLNLAVHQG